MNTSEEAIICEQEKKLTGLNALHKLPAANESLSFPAHNEVLQWDLYTLAC